MLFLPLLVKLLVKLIQRPRPLSPQPYSKSRQWPPWYKSVNLFGQPYGFLERNHDALPVLYVIVAKLASFPVRQPLLTNLISTNK